MFQQAISRWLAEEAQAVRGWIDEQSAAGPFKKTAHKTRSVNGVTLPYCLYSSSAVTRLARIAALGFVSDSLSGALAECAGLAHRKTLAIMRSSCPGEVDEWFKSHAWKACIG